MNRNDYEQLVELITKEVMRVVSESADKSDVFSVRPKALVIGKKERLPISVMSEFDFDDIEQYKKTGCIDCYDRVYVSELTLTELCDIALGRDSSAQSCAVIKALLCGKQVFISEKGLPHRQYAGKGSRELYKQYEGYVNRIISFGAVLIRDSNSDVKNKNMNAFADNMNDKVITEKIAKKLVEKSGETVKLRSGTVLTPSAKDVFNHSDKTVEFV